MLYAIIAAIVLVADQWMKYWVTVNVALNTGEKALIPGLVKLVNIHNSGASFGLLGNFAYARWLFLGVAVVFVVAVILLLVKGAFKSRFANWCMVLAMAGAVGNCIDRLLYGYVVDMFKLEFMNFAIFNVADIVLVVCCLLFIVALFTAERGEDDDEDEEDGEVLDEPAPEPAKPAEKPAKGGYDLADIFSDVPEAPAKPEKPAKPARKAAKKPEPVEEKPEDVWTEFKKKLDDEPAAPAKKPADEEYDLESILAEFRDV